MRWWRQIKNWFYRRALRRAVPVSASRRVVGWEHVEYIGMLVDGDEPVLVDAARRWAGAMGCAGKRVVVLYCTTRRLARGEKPEPDTLYCSEVNWYGKPSGVTAERFSSQGVDLLMVFAQDLKQPMHWLASVSKAPCRVGMDARATDCLDMVVEMPEGRYGDFLKEVERLMRLNVTSSGWVA